MTGNYWSPAVICSADTESINCSMFCIDGLISLFKQSLVLQTIDLSQ